MACKISIVIPVYNTKDWLPRCLESVVSQGVPEEDYEIVIVNDGSTDGSETVAAEFAAGRPNVRVLSQPNAGLSAARNAGLAAAGGQYVWFVDSDDRIAPESLPKILAACASAPDMVALGSAREGAACIRPDGYYPPELAGTVMSGREMMRRRLLKSVCSPFYVFRRQFLADGGFCFMPGILHEDEEFTPRVLYAAATVAFVPEVCYVAVAREGSITRKANPKRSGDLLTVAARLDAHAAGLPKADRYLFSRHVTDVLNAAMKLSRDYTPEECSRLQAKLYENRRLLVHLTRCRIPKFVFEGWALRLFPRRSLRVYRLLQGGAAKAGLSTERKK